MFNFLHAQNKCYHFVGFSFLQKKYLFMTEAKQNKYNTHGNKHHLQNTRNFMSIVDIIIIYHQKKAKKSKLVEFKIKTYNILSVKYRFPLLQGYA